LRGGGAGAYTSLMILSLERRSQTILKARDSRFIGIATPVETESEALERIADIRSEYPDATHCCFAYRLGAGDTARERSHDAGEPAGSAGAPILSVIRGRGLGNLLVCVVRYFGGTKLGIGGLSRAYRDAARAAIEAGSLRASEERIRVRVELPLALVGEARSRVAQLGGEVQSEEYSEAATLSLLIAASRAGELKARLDDLTRGSAVWEGKGGVV